jgi:beta-glucanase (GH16 family)
VVNSKDVPAGYSLVWNDEFDGRGHPDSSKWGYDTWGNYIGWGNGEKEFYTNNDLSNAYLSDGKLHIVAREQRNSEVVSGNTYNYDYTSARLITRDKASWTYGFIEVRAKIPGGGGTWPAIWALGTDGDWPEAGEIDLMEQWGTDTACMGTFHVTDNNGSSGYLWPSDIFNTFHNFQLLWTPTVPATEGAEAIPAKLTIMVDGEVMNTWTKDLSLTDPAASYAQWPFDKPEYLLLNLALSGNVPIDTSIFPRDFQVDYVRVYQKP